MNIRLSSAALLFALTIFLAAPLTADETAIQTNPAQKTAQPKGDRDSAQKFLRIRRDDSGEPIAMQTAIIRYVATDDDGKQTVDLIGAVHVADKRYYTELNENFRKYDALLYELVAPADAAVPIADGAKRRPSVVSRVQMGIKSLLALEFQLDHIDYTPKNFVHADMTPKEFAKSMTDRGESFWTMFFRLIGQSAAIQAKDPGRSSDAAILAALFSNDRALQLKRIMAVQFEDLDMALAGINGPDGSTIITERNKKALQVLRRELKEGKKKIGVFYGAGHLPDMEERLLKDFGMKRAKVRWLTAWSLDSPQQKPKPKDK